MENDTEDSVLSLHKDGMTDKRIVKILEARGIKITLGDVKKIRINNKRQSYHWQKHGKYQGGIGIQYSSSDVDVVKAHSKTETWKHFLLKCIIAKILMDAGHAIITEARCARGEIDVFDIDTKIAYEVETQCTKAKIDFKVKQYSDEGIVNDVIVFDLDDYTLDYSIQDLINAVKGRCRI